MKPTKIIKKGAALVLAAAMILTGATGLTGGMSVVEASEIDFNNLKPLVPRRYWQMYLGLTT